MATRKSSVVTEFGDFQTPAELSQVICRLLLEKELSPASMIEPTCGKGSFLFAALDTFASIEKALGIDINAEYVNQVEQLLQRSTYRARAQAVQGDFFDLNWNKMLDELPEPTLVIGNPPWVTNTELAKLNSPNLPEKSNLQGFSGFDAISGKSNFDISEWMLIRLLESLSGRRATLAMLCKTIVARKVLTYAWTNDLAVRDCSMYLIDAKKYFNASVQACLLICHTDTQGDESSCDVYRDLSRDSYETTFGLVGSRLAANRSFFERWRHLEGNEYYRWRSGIKHDCAKVMELFKIGDAYENGLGELYDLEDRYLFPMLKSSQIAKRDAPVPQKWMLVPQSYVGEDTFQIRGNAPKTWKYLIDHQDLLNKRKSSIYKNRPPFSIFGVGDYTFSTWKVAISGLYKQLNFAVVGPHQGKPTVLDDTCYAIACKSAEEAGYLADLLNSEIAKQFLLAFVFWDDKRPITAEILNRLDLLALAKETGSPKRLKSFLSPEHLSALSYEQLTLFG